VTERLQKDGYRVIARAIQLRSLDGDAAYLRSILAQEEGPFVLVGHSYGGAVITNAAAGDPNVDALVYVDAFVPDAGEDILRLAGEGSLVPSSIEVTGYPPFGATDVDVYIKPESFRETLAGDLPKEDAAVLAGHPASDLARSGQCPDDRHGLEDDPLLVSPRDRGQDDHAGCATPHGRARGRHHRGGQGLTPVADLPARQGRRADRGRRCSDRPRVSWPDAAQALPRR
jgi:pimeloyl-ACP methyl ester carboxylesterase